MRDAVSVCLLRVLRLLRVLLLAIAGTLCADALVFPRAALAADPPKSANEQRALDLYGRSAASYRAGNFREAVELLKEAYALKPEPVLLYNLARAYEGLGDLDNALTSYSDFLAAQPTTPDRGAIEKRIATLKQQIEERERLKRERREADARAAQPPPADHRTSVVPWVVAGVGAAGVAAGAVFGAMALGRHSTAQSDPQQASAAQENSDAKTFATVANIAIIAGSAVAVGGVVWAVLASRRGSPPPQSASVARIRPVIGFGAAGVVVDLP